MQNYVDRMPVWTLWPIFQKPGLKNVGEVCSIVLLGYNSTVGWLYFRNVRLYVRTAELLAGGWSDAVGRGIGGVAGRWVPTGVSGGSSCTVHLFPSSHLLKGEKNNCHSINTFLSRQYIVAVDNFLALIYWSITALTALTGTCASDGQWCHTWCARSTCPVASSDLDSA